MTIITHPRDVSVKAPAAPIARHDDDHERVVIRQDARSGLRLIVAVHSTVLGPALGGLRFRAYPGGLREALDDVLALSRTMTLKASAAGLDLGGGKAVMIDDGREDLRRERLEGVARVVNELEGCYITAEDIGTTMADMDFLAGRTPWVVGRSVEHGGAGDPSPVTAETVLRAMRCGLRAATGSDELEGRRVGVIGVGKVGSALAGKLAAAGAHVIVSDVAPGRAERFAADHEGVRVAPSAEAILGMELDVLAPCAAGGMIDDALAGAITCKVVAGAANNPLTSPDVAERLARRGILYVPDFLANCGGLIHVGADWHGFDPKRVEAGIERAMTRLERAIATAAERDETPLDVAERHALERLHSGT
jgi:glutamate dehydrogenase/leucine dehydrogenase